MSLNLDFHKLEAVGHGDQHTSEKGAVIQDEKLGFIGNFKNRISGSILLTRDPCLVTLDSRKIRNLILILTRHYFLLSFLEIPVILSFTTFRDSKFYMLYLIRFLKMLPIDFPTNNSSIISVNLRIVNLSARK